MDLDFSDRVVDVIEEGFDAVVRFADAGDTRLMSRALGMYRRRLVASPASTGSVSAHDRSHQWLGPADVHDPREIIGQDRLRIPALC